MAEMECPYCNGHNVIKCGVLPSGRQRYKCHTCGKGFSTGEIVQRQRQNVTQYKCPYCGGTLGYRGWNSSGSRRYRCRDCGKSCSENTIANIEPIKPQIKECPYCHSTHTNRAGSLRDGSKRYICKDCGKGFSDKTIVRDLSGITCTYCNSANIVSSGKDTKTGKQRYLCKDCNKKFVLDAQKQTYQRYEKVCPRCGHNQARKAGQTHGKQYYQCLQCNHKYLENALFRCATEEDKKYIISLYEQGKTREEISVLAKVSVKTVFNILKKANVLKCAWKTPQGELRKKIVHDILNGKNMQQLSKETGYSTKLLRDIMRFEYAKETLSPQQEQLLYKFGVECAVPVDYLAPYVHCSQRLCKEFLSKFEIHQPKRPEITERQKAFDKMELDKFVRS